jgi:hypothetical protein
MVVPKVRTVLNENKDKTELFEGQSFRIIFLVNRLESS